MFSVSGTTRLIYEGSFDLWGQNDAPWIAADKTDTSFICSSNFNNVTEVIQYHDADAGPALNLDWFMSIPLTDSHSSTLTFSGVQGGEFNAGGRFFMLAQGGPNGPGVYMFVFEFFTSGGPFVNQWVLKLLDYYPAVIGGSQEFEGITVGRIDPPGANDLSQIHAVLNSGGNVYFKHWSVTQNTSHFTLP